jgi:hypothetical protein
MTLMYKRASLVTIWKPDKLSGFRMAAILFSPFENRTRSLFLDSLDHFIQKNILFMTLLCIKWSSLVTIRKLDISDQTTIYYWSGSTKLDSFIQKRLKNCFMQNGPAN